MAKLEKISEIENHLAKVSENIFTFDMKRNERGIWSKKQEDQILQLYTGMVHLQSAIRTLVQNDR